MRDFRKLDVWKRSHSLTLDVYRNTAAFPRQEVYGLTAQLRRSADSIPANIAEGCGRSTDADFGRFLTHAAGSASETEYHLLLATDLGYLTRSQFQKMEGQSIEVRRMLAGLMRRLKKGN